MIEKYRYYCRVEGNLGDKFISQYIYYHKIMNEEKLQHLLKVVIDHYIGKWDPIGSKFLNSLEDFDYAPSTLRKYLNVLEKEGLLFQPYNSSWRVPTPKGMSNYMDALIDRSAEETKEDDWYEADFDVDYARNDLRSIIETLGEYVDWASVWFLKEDEYYYLWITNLLRDSFIDDHETTRYLIKFIESKELVQTLDTKMTKRGKIYYTFLESNEKVISILYTKIEVNWYDAIVSIIWPSRVDHKKNVNVLKKMMRKISKHDAAKF